MEGFISPEN